MGMNEFDTYTMIYLVFGLVIMLVAVVGSLFQKNTE
jgi:hypothetical protein